MQPTILIALALLAPADNRSNDVAAVAQGAPKTVTEAQFWKASQAFVRKPLDKSASEQCRNVLLFAMQSKSVAVVITKVEFEWIGEHKQYKSALMTAYLAGNIESQLRSGVKRNDRYAGLLHLFQAYRLIRKRDAQYRLKEVDRLLKLQQDGKLLAHVVKLEKDQSTDVNKLTEKPGKP